MYSVSKDVNFIMFRMFQKEQVFNVFRELTGVNHATTNIDLAAVALV